MYHISTTATAALAVLRSQFLDDLLRLVLMYKQYTTIVVYVVQYSNKITFCGLLKKLFGFLLGDAL
jgi:hypothetical protein